MNIKDCRIIDLPKKADDRGLLSIVEGSEHIPFDIKRIFYLYDVPPNKLRGAHAHKTLEQFIICFGGGVDIEVDDGISKQKFFLNKPWQGLYIPPRIWTTVDNFRENTICLVLASAKYEEADYYRIYDEFLAAVA